MYIATDLALIIIHKYPDLIVIQNKLGFSPLKLLATRPSAFKSGYKMIWWKKILYHCKCATFQYLCTLLSAAKLKETHCLGNIWFYS